MGRIIKLIAPSAWASYLVNGDASGLAAEEKAQADSWLARHGLAACLSCEDYGTTEWHDARPEVRSICDCQTYFFPAGPAWRIYADGREFGIDYSRSDAILVARDYRKQFPRVKYRIRKVRTRGGEKWCLRRERLNSGGYTSMGYYYGLGQPLYFADSEGNPSLHREFRATNRDAAKRILRDEFPQARFYN